MNSNKIPLVSIRLTTYNHAAFITDAMDGIMKQQTTFPVEVVIGDDFSSDDTLRILQRYENTKNIQIKILQRKRGDTYDEKRKMFGRLFNFQDVMEQCIGRYVALLDGDDYWEDPDKLQKQFNYLENNPDVAISFHNVTLVDEKRNLIDADFLKTDKREFSQSDLVAGAVLPVCSVMMRNILNFPSNFTKVKNGDTFVFAMMAKHGRAHLHQELNAFYRIHDGGVYSKKPLVEKKRQSLTTFLELKKVIEPKFISIVNRNLASNSWVLTKHSNAFLERMRFGVLTMYYGGLFLLSKYLKITV